MAEINPQFSTVRVLKPFEGFENVYQGLSADIPIAMPGTLDFEAGKPHYQPTLLDFLVVPFGARIILWIPLCCKSDPEDQDPVRTYTYQVLWRLRNVQEAVESQLAGAAPTEQKQYQIEDRALGFTTIGVQQVIVPCAMETIAYEQSEPGSDFANGSVHLRGNFIVPDGEFMQTLPRLPSGVLPGEFGEGATIAVPNYLVYETTAAGNEMSVVVKRSGTIDPGDKWDFTSNAADRTFSNTYGTDNGNHASSPNLGIFVLTGTP